MHIDDVQDDNLVAEETVLHAHTREQTRAADAIQKILWTDISDSTRQRFQHSLPLQD